MMQKSKEKILFLLVILSAHFASTSFLFYRMNNTFSHPNHFRIESNGLTYNQQFNGTGGEIQIELEQEYLNTTIININPNSPNNNSINIPTPIQTYLTEYIEVNVSSITANNYSTTLEDQFTFYDESFGIDKFVATTITVDADLAYLSNISIFVYPDAPDLHLYIYILPTKWNSTSGKSEPGPTFNPLDSPNATKDINNVPLDWVDISLSNMLLNASMTENRTWAIILYSDYINHWIFNPDNADEDKTASYYYTLSEQQWMPVQFGGNTVDFLIKYGVAAINQNAKPSDIQLRINSTIVQDQSDSIVGRWFNTSQYSGGTSQRLNLTFACNWPSTSVEINAIRVIYRSIRTNSSMFTLFSPSAQYVNWSVEYLVNDLDSQFTNFKCRFLIPDGWQNILLFENGTLSSLYYRVDNVPLNQSKMITIFILNSMIKNFLIDSSTTNINPNVSLITGLTNQADIIYSGSNVSFRIDPEKKISGQLYIHYYLHEQNLTITKQLNLNYSSPVIIEHDLIDSILGRNFTNCTIILKWNNITDALFWAHSFSYYRNSDIDLINYEVLSKNYTKNDIVTINLRYFEKENDISSEIPNGNISITSDTTVLYQAIFNQSTFFYDVYINCSSLNLGKNEMTLRIRANYCKEQSIKIIIYIENKGDSSDPLFWTALIGISILILGGFLIKRIKKRKNKQ